MFKLNLDPQSWSKFLQAIVKPGTYDESCAWLYISKPFRAEHTVFVFQITNVALKGESPATSYAPDKKELNKVKKLAKDRMLTKIGNVHTHVIKPSGSLFDGELLQFASPSKKDLKYARKFNDLIKGIVVVQFEKDLCPAKILAVLWHDQFGNILNCDFSFSLLPSP